MQKVKEIWFKIEIPVIILAILIGIATTVASIVGFDSSKVSEKSLESLYVTNFDGYELFGFITNMTRNLVLYLAIHLFNKNLILSAILIILLPRLAALPFANRSMNVAAKQSLLRPEYEKLKIYYSDAPNDKSVNALYTQDSQRIAKKFNISTMDASFAMMFSTLPVIFVSFAVSAIVRDLIKINPDVTVLGIYINQSNIILAVISVIFIILQSYLPLKNLVGANTEQQKQMVLFMPFILIFVFMKQPAFIPIIWMSTYVVYCIQLVYFHRLKKFDREKDLKNGHIK